MFYFLVKKMQLLKTLFSNARGYFYYKRLEILNKRRTTEEVFTRYWMKNHWKNKESKSGDGSTLEYTESIRNEIPVLIKSLSVKSILDAPCGDFNWFKEITLPENVKYIGADIVKEMIEDLSKNFSNKSRSFVSINVIEDKLPNSDIWLCRDLVFHLPEKNVFQLIENFINSDISYLLITSHTSSDVKNKDIVTGGFRLVNLLKHPYNLPRPETKIKDYIDGFPERHLLLYTKNSLEKWRLEVSR